MIKDLISLSWQLIKDVFEDHWLWTITILVIILLLLGGCAKPKNELRAMDKFWKTLGSGDTSDLGKDENKSK